MESNNEIPTDAERMERLIEALDTNANRLNTRLGYSSPSSIRHVVTGRNKISVSMADKIVKEYPNVNYLYLLKGEGEPLIQSNDRTNQNNMFHENESSLNSMLEIPALLKQQNDLIADQNLLLETLIGKL